MNKDPMRVIVLLVLLVSACLTTHFFPSAILPLLGGILLKEAVDFVLRGSSTHEQ